MPNSPAEIASSAPEPEWRQAALSLLSAALGPFLGLVLVFALFSAADFERSRRMDKTPKFCTFATVQKILRDSSQTGVAALGMTLIIIAGGIDLSAGTAMALSATVTAWFFRAGYSPAAAISFGLLTGCHCGFFNGWLINRLRVVPFIVTLGTMTIFLGTGLILSKDTPIRAYGKVPQWILDLESPAPEPEWLLVSSGVWVMVALAVVVAVLLHRTVFGRRVFALGSNEATARLCGINVTAVRIAVYTIAGFFVGVAGLFQFAMLGGEGSPTSGNGKELEMIAAVVIGGGSLSGGRGSVVGTLCGACLTSTILVGCVMLGIPSAYQKVILGVIIVAAVTIDQVRQQRLAN